MQRPSLTRRTLLKGAVAGTAVATVIPSNVLGRDGTVAPSEKVTVGHIGVGGRGRGVLRGIVQSPLSKSIAVSDAYKTRRDNTAKQLGGKAYLDYKELLGRDDIDCVVIATPDHAHVPLAIAAARTGKDCYVEKPLGLSIEQCLACREVFKKHNRLFQYGTQQRSIEHCRKGCELVRNGYIGKVHTIEVVAPNGGKGGSTEEAPIPPDLDYNTWIGPAPMKPYTKNRCNPKGSYWIYDYSIGYLGGWGAHPLDLMIWGSDADLSGLVTVEGKGDIPTEGLFDCVYNWDMDIMLGDVKMKLTPGRDATKFIGDEGWISVSRGNWDANPKSLLEKELSDKDKGLQVSTRHQHDFIEAVKNRREAVAPLDEAVRSDIISHLCDIAVRTGRKITWDPKKETIVGDEKAAKMMHRDLREGWTL